MDALGNGTLVGMEKIPTLFVRNPEDRKHVLNEITPGCEWVIAGEGVATRKYDGTCVMFDGVDWWARREVKPGKSAPENFVTISTDENTGKTMGWEPIAQSGFAKWGAEAIAEHDAWASGTYELCGPRVNGNPEGLDGHVLIRHETADRLVMAAEITYGSLVVTMAGLGEAGMEGLVWHHPDGRMAKLKVRDFPAVVLAA